MPPDERLREAGPQARGEWSPTLAPALALNLLPDLNLHLALSLGGRDGLEASHARG